MFKKARSLANSFDNFMKRKGSRDDFGLSAHLRDASHLNTGMQKNDNHSPDNSRQSPISGTSPEMGRRKSLRISPEQTLIKNGSKSSMMDMLVQSQCISTIGQLSFSIVLSSLYNCALVESLAAFSKSVTHQKRLPRRPTGAQSQPIVRGDRRY